MPSSKNYVRDYKREYQTSLARGERQGHVLRLRARRLEMKKGLVKPHDHKDVDHIKPISRGGNNSTGLRVESEHKNRSYARTGRGAIRMADGGLVGSAADALKNREASIDAQVDRAVKPPPQPSPLTQGAATPPATTSMPVDPLTAQLEAKQRAAKAAPPPQKPGVVERVKKFLGMQDGGYVYPEDNMLDTNQLMSRPSSDATRMAHGGKVPGKGRGDKIHIMGEPGEYMLPKDTVQAVGVPMLDALREATHKGAVRPK